MREKITHIEDPIFSGKMACGLKSNCFHCWWLDSTRRDWISGRLEWRMCTKYIKRVAPEDFLRKLTNKTSGI